VLSSSIASIAYVFYVVAVLLAVPGTAYLLFDFTRRLRTRFFPKPVAGMSVPNPDAILMLLDAFTKGITALAKVGGFIGEIVAGLLAGLAISAVLVATLLFFTARGLLHQEPWARYVAGALMANLLLLSVLSSLTSGKRRPKRLLVSLILAVLSGLSLHALWQGYRA
jgi:hypothetical protein